MSDATAPTPPTPAPGATPTGAPPAHPALPVATNDGAPMAGTSPHAAAMPAAPVPEHAAPAAPADPAVAAEAGEAAVSVDQVKLVLRRVKDPELNLNVVDLGLIYDIRVAGARVDVDMSLTSPGCPSGPEIMGDVESQLRSLPEVSDVSVNLVWDPYWTPDRIEPRVRAYLGF